MKYNIVKFLFIAYILTFVIITLKMSLDDLKLLSVSFADVMGAPITNLVNSALQMVEQDSSNVVIEYPTKEHVTNILTEYFTIVKDSLGFVSLSTTAIAVIYYIFRSDEEINLFKSIAKYLKNLFF
ncbi:hypothetical protein ABE073_04780 [Lederbergia citrisecunda]|uniref:hypothetical protein n=1 Tax=Lederbergia citrisecunda TaxID=2833583 RepID=UPI003D2B0CEA